MSFSSWLSGLKRRYFVRGNSRTSRKSRWRFTSQLIQLEDRCLLSTFTPVLPSQGTEQSSGLNAVVYTPQGDPNFNQANLPAAKLVTIMNNSSDVLFPIFYGSNSTADTTAGQVVRLVLTNPGMNYNNTNNPALWPQVVIKDLTTPSASGAGGTVKVNGQGQLFGLELTAPGAGYQPGDQLQVTFNDSANGNKGSDGAATAYVSRAAPGVQQALYDPKDPINETYRGYVGEIDPVTGQYDLGLQPGDQVTVMVPIAFWDGGRLYFASNGSVPLSSTTDPGYPLQANTEWLYNPTATPITNANPNLGAGLSYIVAPTASNPMPLYGADFADPKTDYANPNGVVMWYHETLPNLPHQFAHDNPSAYSEELTFRDLNQPFIAPDMPASEVQQEINYDVSYVDSLALPVSMEATQAATNPATPGPLQFAWLGSDLSVTQMQQAIATFTTNDLSGGGETIGGTNGLGTYFGGLGYDQYYTPPDNSPSGAITSINNPNGGPVTITVGSTSGLLNGMSVLISGVSGQTAINNPWVISGVVPGSNTFVLTGITGDGTASSGGTYTAQTTGIHVEKLPAGYNIIADSENQNVQSTLDPTKYGLVSGGILATIPTVGTGTSTAGSTTIQNVSNAIASQLVPGMLWSAVSGTGVSTPYFPIGTTIASITVGTGVGDTSTITMSNAANLSGSPGGSNNGSGPGGSWTFNGSQYSTANSSPPLQGSIAANGNQITGLDPAVGIYLRPGMLVTGSQIPPGTFIAANGISADFKTITLTQSIGSTPSSGPYTFLGGPDSPYVQKLIDVWYSWADYYVNQLASGSNAAPSGSFPGTTTANGGRTDYNSLILKITDASFDMTQLRVGDVVTSAGTTLTPNPTLPAGSANYDPSLNYTIVSINQTDRTVELSLPVAVTGAVSDTFTFTAPQYIVRSSDAPAATGTAGTIPYTLNFTAGGAAALQFAQTVYDVMQSFSLIRDPGSYLSRSALLLQFCIGGNVGSFIANNGLIPGRPSSLPTLRTNVQLRDEIKSILRGVYSFTAVPDQSQWYPNPATPTPGATLDQGSGAQPVTFGIYNLSPYVWFVHVVLHNSSYGFSLDDDVANAQTNTTSSIEIAFGGNAYTAPITQTPPPTNTLNNPEAFTPGARYGTQQSQGYIDTTSSYAIQNAKNGMTTISGLSQVAVARLLASTAPSDPLGALITSDSPGLLPPGVRVALITVLPPVGGVDNQSWVTFFTPKGWTAPTDQTKHLFTFSSFTTSVPTNVTPPSPAQAAPGTVITITGNGFTGVYGVSFNGIPGTLVAGAITGISNPNAGTITINTANTQGLINGDTVTISGVTGQTAINGSWVVSNVIPNTSFQLTGITGNGAASSGGNWIDGTDSAIKVIVPSFTPNANGTTYPGPTGKIAVQNPSGVSYSTTSFTIGSSGNPTFTGIGLPSGTTASGSLNTTVTLFGSGFTGTSAVTFNGGSGFAINQFTPSADGTQLQITIPIGASGTGTFTVTVGGNTYPSTGYTFTDNQPVIAASNPFSPASGPVGTKVTITGSGFTGADQAGGGVTINGTAAINVQVVNDTTILAEVAPGTTTGQVVVTTSAGSGNSGTNNFTVSAYPTPNVTSATPNSGAVGALMQLTGTGFTGVDQPGGGITFNGTAATNFTVVNDTTINVYVPLSATTGPIVVSNPTNSSNSVAFTVGPAGAPTITSFSPGGGPVNTPVTITGSGFTNATDVQFNGTDAFFVIVNDNTINAYVPAGATTGPITVVTGLGSVSSTTDFVVASQLTFITSPGSATFPVFSRNGTSTSGSTSLTVTNVSQLATGMFVSGPGIQANTTITVSGNTVTLSQAAGQGSGPGVFVFSGSTFQVTTTGANSLTVVGNLPSGVTFKDNGDGTGTLAGAPSFDTGNFVFQIVASNTLVTPSLTATQTFTLIVSAPPVLTSTVGNLPSTSTTYNVGATNNPAIKLATAPPGGTTLPTTLSVSGLPKGVLFSQGANGTGTISGVPVAGTGGVYPVTITASNATGSTVQVFTLTVNQLAPSFATAASTVFTVGQAGTFVVRATGFPTLPTLTTTATPPSGLTYTSVPNVTTSGTSTLGSLSLTVTSGAGLLVGMGVTGPGIANGTTVTAFTATTVTLSANAILGAGAGPFSFGGIFTITSTAAATARVSTIPIVAAIGATMITQTFTLTVQQPALAITSPARIAFQQSVNNTFTVSTTGLPPATLSIPTTTNTALTAAGLSFTASPGKAIISGTPNAGTAGTNFTITISAKIGTTTVTQVLTLAIVNFTTPTGTVATFTAGKAGTATIPGSFPAGTVFTVTNGLLPAGIKLTRSATGITVSGTPPAGSGGSYSFQILSNNSLSALSPVYTIVVNQPQPVLTSLKTATFVVGQAGSFTVTTTGFPVAAIGLQTVNGFPKGLSFTDNGNGTATLSGTPLPGTGGTYTLIWNANNGSGIATQTFTLVVNPPPMITSAGSATFVLNSPGSFLVTATGYPLPKLTASGLPTGVVLVPQSNGIAILQGTVRTKGTYNIFITATRGTKVAVQELVLTVM